MNASPSVETLLTQIQQGLFRISVDRLRALSTHETEALIEQLRTQVDQALALINSAP